jgi:hypothetical protein
MKRPHRRQFLYLAGLGGAAALGGAATWLAAQPRQYVRVRAMQLQVLRIQAGVVAYKIDQFIGEIESQLGWTTQLPWSAGSIEQRRFDVLRLLRQVPAITEVSQLDAAGMERVRVDRRAIEPWGSLPDYSQEFSEAVARGVYYGPVYFKRESEPYMRLALAGKRRDAGVSMAEVSLKLLWDAIAAVGGPAFVIDAQGRLIAHPDISLVLRKTDMLKLAQVRAARDGTSERVQEGEDIEGRKVLTAYAPVAKLGWLVFVELPVEEVYAAYWR